MLAVRRDRERVSFTVRMTPRASANAVGGERDGALLVRVSAPPVDGKANEALLKLLAAALDVPRGAVRLEHGAATRIKRVSVPLGAEAALRRLAK
jgi:uncharacterized protein YggU (UPF0235/DUF167 family)